jgi:hypothetical protein
VFTCIAAVVAFAVVQDRVTRAGVGEYVSAYREAAAGVRPPVTIDQFMKPAVGRSVQHGALWSGAVLAVGFAGTWAARRRPGRG